MAEIEYLRNEVAGCRVKKHRKSATGGEALKHQQNITVALLNLQLPFRSRTPEKASQAITNYYTTPTTSKTTHKKSNSAHGNQVMIPTSTTQYTTQLSS